MNKSTFQPRSDIQELKYHIELLRQETKTGLAETKSDLKSEINKLIIWIVATMFAAAALMITIAKIFFAANY